MSILIKGMEMPECCDECVFMETQDSGFGNDYICGISKEDVDGVCDCPYIEIRPHGDLVDINALKLAILDVDYVNKHDYLKGVLNAINNAPIVIPADKDGET